MDDTTAQDSIGARIVSVAQMAVAMHLAMAKEGETAWEQKLRRVSSQHTCGEHTCGEHTCGEHTCAAPARVEQAMTGGTGRLVTDDKSSATLERA